MHKASILIVEDDLIQAQGFRLLLEGQGYRVLDITHTGEEAIRKTEALDPDLLLMDIDLAGEMDGIEAAGRIQSVTDVPVIYLTSYADQATFERAKRTGPLNYLHKTASDLELHMAIEMALYRKKLENDLKGRIKELNCLYNLSEIAGRSDLSLEEVLKATVDLLPSGWQYSEEACARIIVKGREYRTDGFWETIWRQRADITIHDRKIGSVEVYYLEEKPKREEGPFLIEERLLIKSIAERIGRRIERHKIQGELERYQKHLEDVVEKRTADLLESRAKLESVFEGISEPLMVVDRNLQTKIFNEAAYEYYGSKYAMPPNRLCFEGAEPDSGPCKTCPIPEAVLKGEFCSFERKGFIDSERLEKVSVYPVKKDGEYTGEAIIRILDITEEVRLNEEMARAQKLIALGTLMAGVAHEINNPNNYIMINAPILLEVWKSILPILDEYHRIHGDFSVAGLPYDEIKLEVPGLISGIEDGARRIMRIVKELKEFSAQDSQFHLKAENINAIILQAVSLLAHKIKKATNQFRVDYGADLPQVRGDFQKLEQVMVNLIQNALEAIPDKNKGVSLKSFADREKRRIMIEIRDEGIGIPEKDLSRIMDPFYTTKRTVGGTGLGLAVSNNIIRHHAGTINVQSEPGKGSVFLVSLPAVLREDRKRILLVDDDPRVREMIKTALAEETNYLVTEAASGIEACISLGKDRPDLLILDLLMPAMDGREVCRVIKEKPFLSNTRVIVITGHPDSPLINDIKAMGFQEILPKPFHLQDLLTRIHRILRGIS